MLYLFLDESGDLGFDFVQKKPSEYFVVSILALQSEADRKKLAKAIDHTLRKKLNPKNKKKAPHELKGMDSSLAVKRYFLKQLGHVPFDLHAIIIPKRQLFFKLAESKDQIYNEAAKLLLDRIPLEQASERLILILDRSKNKHAVKEFNKYVFISLKKRLKANAPLIIHHYDSQATRELQAADLFAWGIFRKYQHKDTAWYNCFKEHIKTEHLLNEQ